MVLRRRRALRLVSLLILVLVLQRTGAAAAARRCRRSILLQRLREEVAVALDTRRCDHRRRSRAWVPILHRALRQSRTLVRGRRPHPGRCVTDAPRGVYERGCYYYKLSAWLLQSDNIWFGSAAGAAELFEVNKHENPLYISSPSRTRPCTRTRFVPASTVWKATCHNTQVARLRPHSLQALPHSRKAAL